MLGAIRTGTVETSRAANDTQTRYKPGPSETVNPSCTVLSVATSVSLKLLIDSAFLRAAVQMAAPMSRKRLLRMVNVVEARKMTVCLATPLREGRKANCLERIRGWRKGGGDSREQGQGRTHCAQENQPVSSLCRGIQLVSRSRENCF